MKKSLLIAGALALVAAVGLVGAGVAYAGSEGPGHGPQGEGPGPGGGILAEYMDGVHEKLAEALGISVEELEAAQAEGQTFFNLAEANGVELEELWQVMQDARAEAIEQAIADGAITQEQADWMLERQARMGARHDDCDGTGPIGEGSFGPGRMGRFGGRFASSNS